MVATSQNCKKKTLTLPGMARLNFKPRCFEQLKNRNSCVKFPKITWLMLHNNTWCTILKMWDQTKTLSTVHVSLVSCPLKEVRHPKTRFFWVFEIFWVFAGMRAPKKFRGIIYVSTRIYVLPVLYPRACFHPKSTSTGSTEQVHVQAVHVCMLWAAVWLLVKSWAL
jgi:hypothetical protein